MKEVKVVSMVGNGPKGDPMRYEDLTEEQRQDLFENIDAALIPSATGTVHGTTDDGDPSVGITVASDNSLAFDFENIIGGLDGVTPRIISRVVEYAQSISETTVPDSGWSTTRPSLTPGYYLWTKSTITYNTGDSVVDYSVTYNAVDGTNGTNGTDGDDGLDAYSYFATCTTNPANITEKIAYIDPTSYELAPTMHVGLIIDVHFSYANSNIAPVLTIRIGDSSDYETLCTQIPIYTQGSPGGFWVDESTITLVYTSTGYFYVANTPVYASTATIGNPSAAHVYIDADSVDMIDASGNDVGSFSGTNARIGRSGYPHLEASTTGLDIYGSTSTYPKLNATSTGIKIYKDANNHANITSSGLEVFQGGTSQASFGSTSRIGGSSGTHMILNPSNNGSVKINRGNDQRLGILALSSQTQITFTHDDISKDGIIASVYPPGTPAGNNGWYNTIDYILSDSEGRKTMLSLEAPGRSDAQYGIYGTLLNLSSQDSSKFLVNSIGNATLAGTLTQGSDRRLKTHIDNLGEKEIEFARNLIPVLYERNGEQYYGFYAQDVQEADPNETGTVREGQDGFLSLDYSALIAPLVAYTQSLEARIAELEAKINGES